MFRLSQVYSSTTTVLSTVMVLIGCTMVVTTIVRGGGPLAIGILLGVLFIVVGGGRIFIQIKGRN